MYIDKLLCLIKIAYLKTRKLASYSDCPNTLEFEFNTMNMPFNYINEYNSRNIELIYGDFPHDGTDEILISDL